MGKEKDAAERRLESYNDVFSDVFNVLLFDGKPVIDPEELDDAQPVSMFKADGQLHQEERDVVKRWRRGTLCLGVLGLENETKSENEMPLRVIAYDGAAYKAQLVKRTEDRRAKRAVQPLFPVVTLVLNFGKQRWTGSRSLRECLDIPAELLPFVQDYRIQVFDIAFLPPETVAQFQSDFRILADYLVQLRTKNDYDPPEQLIGHIDALLKMMEVTSGVQGFMEQLEEQRKDGKEPKMVTGFLLERTKHDKAEGRREGRRVERVKSIRALMDNMGWDVEEAMDMLNVDPEEREICLKMLDQVDLEDDERE